MYLLILLGVSIYELLDIHLHPTMYLLIHLPTPFDVVKTGKFTSHYVSINS